MDKNSIKNGHIVEIEKMYDFVREKTKTEEAIILWKGTNNQPLVISCKDIEKEIYNPYWISYEDIKEVIGEIDMDIMRKALFAYGKHYAVEIARDSRERSKDEY